MTKANAPIFTPPTFAPPGGRGLLLLVWLALVSGCTAVPSSGPLAGPGPD